MINFNQLVLTSLVKNLRLFTLQNRHSLSSRSKDAFSLAPALSGVLNTSSMNGAAFSTLSYGLKHPNSSETLVQAVLNDDRIASPIFMIQKQHYKTSLVNAPDPKKTFRNLFFKVHYPEDGKYTIKKLKMTKLAGRDPDTGRIIFGCRGGGHKRCYRWIDYHRVPNGTLEEEEPITIQERVLEIKYDPNRSAKIALVGRDEHLRYIIATTSMKPGDMITSTNHIPRIPISPKEGDCHPVAALPFGTQVCCAEKNPGNGHILCVAAGTSAIVTKVLNGKVILKKSAKKEFALDPRCMVVVGRVSNPDHNKVPIGSPNRLRWLGWRPRSGLWQRKDGTKGRKIRANKGPIEFKPLKVPVPRMQLSAPGEGPIKPITPSTYRVT